MTGLTKAALDVISERRRQIEGEGWTPEDDDIYVSGQLAQAAATYALNASGIRGLTSVYWPFQMAWWKPKTPRGDLVKAAALILAEIERIDRASVTDGAIP